MGGWYEDIKKKLLDICEPGRTWKEYNWDEGLQELHELAPKSRRSIFGIKTDEFLEELLTGDTREVLKANYDNYYSKNKKIPFLPSPKKILNAIYVPATIFLFDNAELPENYKEELTELKKDIPDSNFLIKKGDQYISYGFESRGVGTDFALFDYLGYNKNKRSSAWCRNLKTDKVLVVENNDLFRDFLIYNTIAEPYRI